jgi:hypothetical protein
MTVMGVVMNVMMMDDDTMMISDNYADDPVSVINVPLPISKVTVLRSSRALGILCTRLTKQWKSARDACPLSTAHTSPSTPAVALPRAGTCRPDVLNLWSAERTHAALNN